MTKYGVGTLAYLDSFAGMVPCEVLKVTPGPCSSAYSVTVRITANSGAYRRGDVETTSPIWVLPRDYVVQSRRFGQAMIRGGYVWVETVMNRTCKVCATDYHDPGGEVGDPLRYCPNCGSQAWYAGPDIS